MDNFANAYDERLFSPATDLIENDKNYFLSVDLPGMKKEDIKIEVLDNALVISGERQSEQKKETDNYQQIEKVYGSFRRSFSLPKTVNIENIQAFHEDGVLEITIPKTQEVKSKKIEISHKQQNSK
jgi:HSP20 family protein